MKECWFISDNLHTSYADVLDMSFTERAYIMEFITEKNDATQKAVEQKLAEARSKKR